MMTDLIVVGAGIAGSSVTRAARARGLNTLLISAGTPDSLAALAALRGAYHKGPEKALYGRSVELLTEWGCVVDTGAIVTSYRTPESEGRIDMDWILVDPVKSLVEPDLETWCEIVSATAVRLGADLNNLLCEARMVVLCPGVRGMTGRITYGYTMTHPKPAVLLDQTSMRVHHMAPYKSIMMGVVDGQARLGSTSAATEPKAREQISKMLGAAEAANLIATRSGWVAELGRRIQYAEHFTPHEPVTGAVTFGGLHRTGYALAPALAEQFIEVLT